MSGASLRDNSSVPQKSSQVQLGFVCNANECSGCKACVIACKDIYNLAPGKKFRRVLSGESGAWLEKDSIVSPVGVFSYSFSISCNHCTNPVCVQACPRKAITKSHETRTAGSAHQAARTSRRTARASRAAATRFARMAALQARAGIAALGSLGAVAAVAVVVICLVGLVAASAFGIFFSGGDMGDGNPTLREAVAALDAEHEARIEQEKASEAHDEVALSGSTTPWRDVLAVFAVKVAADPSDPRDVITLDDARMDSLRSVFWDMNSIEVSLEERQVTEVGNEEGDAGETGTVKVLRITLTSRTADEMADAYGFDTEQREILSELLDERYDAAWRTVLHGVAGDSGEIVEVAASQIGNVGGQPYWSWYGFGSRVEWCACFVSWCANECGLIKSGAVPKFSYCPTGVQWFKDAGLWRAGGEEPQPGDIVFFDWEGDGTSDHVGIVESCDGRTVETIEGNSGDACRRNAYDVGSASIMGYGTPMY